MFAFAPASRFGYIVYPLGLACWLLLARLTTRPRQLAASTILPRTEVR
jgi:hypothetical protein